MAATLNIAIAIDAKTPDCDSKSRTLLDHAMNIGGDLSRLPAESRPVNVVTITALGGTATVTFEAVVP